MWLKSLQLNKFILYTKVNNKNYVHTNEIIITTSSNYLRINPFVGTKIGFNTNLEPDSD